MTKLWSALWQRGAKGTRALRTIPHLEALEERNLLTSGLVVVPNPPNFTVAVIPFDRFSAVASG